MFDLLIFYARVHQSFLLFHPCTCESYYKDRSIFNFHLHRCAKSLWLITKFLFNLFASWVTIWVFLLYWNQQICICTIFYIASWLLVVLSLFVSFHLFCINNVFVTTETLSFILCLGFYIKNILSTYTTKYSITLLQFQIYFLIKGRPNNISMSFAEPRSESPYNWYLTSHWGWYYIIYSRHGCLHSRIRFRGIFFGHLC